MYWPIFIYLIISFFVGISAWSHAGMAPGLSTWGSSALALVGGGGLKASVVYGTGSQKIAGPIIAAAIMGLAMWLGMNFSVRVFGVSLSGPIWTVVGAVVCFIFTDRKLAT